MDAIADTVGGEVAAKLIVKAQQQPSCGQAPGLPDARPKFSADYAGGNAADSIKVREFAEDVRDGKFVLPIGRRMSLRDAAEAHALGEKGGIGEISLAVRWILKSETLEIFVAKFMNFLRNPYSVRKVLNTRRKYDNGNK